MALSGKQIEAMKYMLKGMNCSEISPLIGNERSTIWRWTQTDEWKKTFDEMQQEIKKGGEQKIIGDLDTYVAELKKLALTSESEKIRLDSLTYLIDRVMGKSTTKVQDITEDRDKKEDFVNLDTIAKDIKENNIIELDKKKAK
ncbi:hypothetical protein [Clostridium botulinum]|uniref:hypothetical protein n=1 Tax=Clostridium botulinum TaxID=1491 RepID=UPI000A175299|nr:hypothetical protein [Clostridium botulinum]AUN11580.1 hypothetical protein RSJ6_14150 [Clostridium botulinum]OSA71597.1 hypothetical protein B2H87_05955 [Clostridium botulinum]